jgi:hypothetical protein
MTYTQGLTFKTERVITKHDIVIMCEMLNKEEMYLDLCEFEPEAISEGGIKFNFKDKTWYKSVRLYVGNWYFITNNVLDDWKGSEDIVFQENTTFSTFLKSFHGAPLFTLDELKVWERCFNEIGVQRKGRYPGKKRLE